MNNFEVPFIKQTLDNECTDTCKHVISCGFCSKFLRANDSNNNFYYLLIIGFLSLIIIVLIFRNK
jgi:hypothetical protein